MKVMMSRLKHTNTMAISTGGLKKQKKIAVDMLWAFQTYWNVQTWCTILNENYVPLKCVHHGGSLTTLQLAI